MEKKTGKPRERNKDKSKKQFLDAVGKILKTKGYAGLKVNDIAATAGLDKKLIYKYFGGVDQLIDEYIRSLDFWSNVSKEDMPVITDGGEAFAKQMLVEQFDYVGNNRELQKILLWGLSEKRKSLKRVYDEREAVGEGLFTGITDPYFGDKAERFRAVTALLVSGAYYLNLYPTNAKTFCGIDVTTEEGRNEIKKALEMLVELVYTTAPATIRSRRNH